MITYTTCSGVKVTEDISELDWPCDLADMGGCNGLAEKQYGQYRACGVHLDRAYQWAADEAYEARADGYASSRWERDYI